MSGNIIKEINNIYEGKRTKSFNELVQRKNKIYSQIPRLKEIDDEINTCAINSTKAILLAESAQKYTYVKELEKSILKLKNEKSELLKKNHISENELEPHFECEKCRDTGYVNGERCNCYKQQLLNYYYSDSNLQAFKDQTFENFNLDLFSNKKEESFGISPRDNMINIKKKAGEFIENFNNPEQKNLFFTGGTGLGKTYLSSAIANELLKNGKTVLYQTAPILLDTIIDYKFNKKGISDKAYEDIFNVDLLIIDDLGVEAINETRLSELFTIINSRLINSKKVTKTIISSNLTLEDLYNRYDERLVSRILGNYNIYRFFGDDLRLKNR